MGRDQETVLITGASCGIGLEVALVFAAKGYNLILVARRRSELEALAERCRSDFGIRADVFPMDLLLPAAPAKLAGELEDDGFRVDILVNNAGLMDMGEFATIDIEQHERLLQLNIVVLTSLARRFLPSMIARRRGRILNVASISAFQPIPSLALYAASKAFVLSLSESLSEELRGSGVTVTALCPGFTKTDMLDRAQDEHSTARSIPDVFVSDVKDVAKEGVEGCLAGKVVIVPGRPNQMMASTVGLYPRWLVRGVGGLFGRQATR
ncbi:MAG: SDR family oxidoreductase [Myxococcota bacterium]